MKDTKRKERKNKVSAKIQQKTTVMTTSSDDSHGKVYYLLIIVLAIAIGGIHSYYVGTLFERSRHFSHLSTLEREMSFRTEMGMYYSYYKTIIESDSLVQGIQSLMNDNRTEYPDTINTLQRFNLYPEVILAVAYKIYMGVSDKLNFVTKECWQVDRGNSLPPIESCEGLGEPSCFYVTCVWIISGITASMIFLCGWFISDSLLGGLLSVVCFFYNHGEGTRVQWTPPLRESFGFPIFLAEMLTLMFMLSVKNVSQKLTFVCTCLTVLFLLFWQFASFVLVTQILSVVTVYVLGLIDSMCVKKYLDSLIVSLLIGYVMLFGNEFLVTSPLVSIIPAVYFLLYCIRTSGHERSFSIWHSFKALLCIVVAIGIKFMITGRTQDAHVWNLLRAKLLNYNDFHTLLYTCAVEFGFMELETPWRLTETLLLPVVVFSGLIVSFQIARSLLKPEKVSETKRCDKNGAIAYVYVQLAAFTIMAILIMRLKLFFTPLLCIAASLICSSKFFRCFLSTKLHSLLIFVLIGLMSIKGFDNIRLQWNIVGEYTNVALEELIHWVQTETPSNAVFAGPMPTMANLMLSTRRNIVNHPHYEDSKVRERTLKVYSLYSRKPPNEVHKMLQELLVDYAILDDHWCFQSSRKGCAMLDLWDLHDPANKNNTSLCKVLEADPTPFKIVFENSVYIVLQVIKNNSTS